MITLGIDMLIRPKSLITPLVLLSTYAGGAVAAPTLNHQSPIDQSVRPLQLVDTGQKRLYGKACRDYARKYCVELARRKGQRVEECARQLIELRCTKSGK